MLYLIVQLRIIYIFSSINNYLNKMTTSLHFSSWKSQSHSMSVSDILLDKPSMIKKMRSLMLEVKGLQTKMFLSKVISYLSNGEMIDSRSSTLRPKLQELSFLKQNKSSVSTAIYTKDLIDDSKQTSDSQYFEKARAKEDADLDTISQAQTVSCSCGLFDMVLNFVSTLIELTIIPNKSEQILINEQFFEVLSKQIKESLQDNILRKEKQHKIQMLKTVDKIFQLQEELKKEVEKCHRISLQNTQFKAQKRKDETMERQLTQKSKRLEIQVQQLKAEIHQLLQEKDTKRRKRSLIRNNQIESLSLQIQLKDREILSLKTIVQTLQNKININDQLTQNMVHESLQDQSNYQNSICKIKDQITQKDEEIYMIRQQLNSISAQLQNMYQLNSLKELTIARLQQQIKKNQWNRNEGQAKDSQFKQQCNQCQTKVQQFQILARKQKSLLQQYQLLQKQYICYQVQQMKRVRILQSLIQSSKTPKITQFTHQIEDIRVTFGSQN